MDINKNGKKKNGFTSKHPGILISTITFFTIIFNLFHFSINCLQMFLLKILEKESVLMAAIYDNILSFSLQFW